MVEVGPPMVSDWGLIDRVDGFEESTEYTTVE